MDKELIKQAFRLGYRAGLEKLAQVAQPARPAASGRPNWSTSRGQAAWQQRFMNADAQGRQKMLQGLDSMSAGMTGQQQSRFNAVADRMRAYANSVSNPKSYNNVMGSAPKGMKAYAPGIYASSPAELRKANTPELQAARRAQNAQIDPMNPNGIGVRNPFGAPPPIPGSRAARQAASASASAYLRSRPTTPAPAARQLTRPAAQQPSVVASVPAPMPGNMSIRDQAARYNNTYHVGQRNI